MSVGVLGPGRVANDPGPTCRCPREVQTAAVRRRQSPGDHRDAEGFGIAPPASIRRAAKGDRTQAVPRVARW